MYTPEVGNVRAYLPEIPWNPLSPRAQQPYMPIPIYDANGRLLRFADAEIVIAHRFHFRLVVTNKGRRRAIPLPHQVKEAHVRAIESLDVRPTSNLGMAFEQCLSTGHVYALRGVRGSK